MVVLWRNFALGFALVGAVNAGCSSSKNTPTPSGTGGSGVVATGGPNSSNDTASIGSDLQVTFNPAYSGYDGVRTFKIPAVVQGLTGLKWSTSDISKVSIEDDPSTGGILVTTKAPGTVKIIARSGQQSGASDLTITDYKSADCEAGDMRYNNGIGIDAGNLFAAFNGSVPKNASCHGCHGDGAQFFSVQHTPQQTGGWSDADIINIAVNGYKPDGTVFVTMLPPQIYQKFHRWDLTDQEMVGVVCYLRSIPPKSQGMLDFGNFMRPGGMMPPAASGAAGAP